MMCGVVILSSFTRSVFADILAGEFTFAKKAPDGALIYLPEDNSLSKKEAVIDQIDKEFTQSIVVGKKDLQATFKNSDTINHNIYVSDTDHNISFDIGLAVPGSIFQQKITWEEGINIKIGCKIHPQMRAWIVSLASKYHHILRFQDEQKTGQLEMEAPSNFSKVRVWMPGYDLVELEIKKGESKRAKTEIAPGRQETVQVNSDRQSQT